MSGHSLSWQQHRTLLIMAVMLVVLRLVPLFSVTTIWPSLERFYAGTVAKEMAAGLNMPLLDYQFSSYEPGWILAGLVCLPFMLAVGFTSFGMALAAVLLDLVQFLIFYRLLARGVNQRVAIFFGLQHIIAPYVLHVTNLFVGFNYFDVPFLTAVFLVLYFKIFRDGRINGVLGGPLASLFCLGLWAGFSTWICFAFALIFGPCLAHWYVYYRRGGWRGAGCLAGGFILGISPLFIRLAAFAGDIRAGIIDRIVAQDAGGFIARLLSFLSIKPQFAWSVCFQWLEILGVLLFVALVALKRDYLIRLGRKLFDKDPLQEDENGIFLLYALYLMTFGAVFCLSDFSNERYYQPIYPFLFGCNAMAVDMLLRLKKRVWHCVGTGALAAHLLLSIGDCLAVPLYKSAPSLKLFRDKAYSYELLGCLVSWRFRYDPRRVMEITGRLKPEDRYALMRGFGFEMALENDGRLMKDYHAYLAQHYAGDDRLRQALDTGLLLGHGQQYYEGTYLSEFYPNVLRIVDREDVLYFLHEHVRLIGFEDAADRPELYTGLGMQFAAVAGKAGLTFEDAAVNLDPVYTEYFRNGMRMAVTLEVQL